MPDYARCIPCGAVTQRFYETDEGPFCSRCYLNGTPPQEEWWGYPPEDDEDE